MWFLLWNEMFSFDKSEALAEAKILLQTGSCKANRSQWIPGIRWCWHLLFWIEIQSLFCRTFRWPKVDYFYMKNTYFKWIQWFPSFWDIPIYIYTYIRCIMIIPINMKHDSNMGNKIHQVFGNFMACHVTIVVVVFWVSQRWKHTESTGVWASVYHNIVQCVYWKAAYWWYMEKSICGPD